MDPSLRTSREIAPKVMLAACIHSCRATAARPAAITKAPCPAVVVFVRPSDILMQGTAEDAGSAGRSLIGSTTLIWECRGLQPRCGVSRRRQTRSGGFPGRVGQWLWSPAAGGWETFEDITDGLCPAFALALPRGGFHSQTESLFDARMAKGASMHSN